MFFILVFVSHLYTSLSDPGSIDMDNNLEILESYNFIYKEINKIKNRYNRIKRKEELDDYSSDDSTHLKLSSEEDKEVPLNDINPMSSKKEKIISEKYDFPINKCKSCQILRPETSHHCVDCHFCVLDRINHCPWMNNCIGLFNKKIYLLFCLYSVILVAYTFLIYFYYNIFQNFNFVRKSIPKTLLSIFWIFYCLVYGGFCFTLLSDERKAVIKEFKRYGKEKNKLMKLKMRLIFGGNFSLKWFFPCFAGGKKHVFSFLKNKKNDDLKFKRFKKAIIQK